MNYTLTPTRRSLRTLYLVLWLLPALAWQEAAWAEVFVIPDGDVTALIAAIATADTNGESDEVILARDGTYVVDTISSHLGGGNAFPLIEPDPGGVLTIQGRGSTILRDPSAEPMRFFYVLENGSLYLNDLTLQGGLIDHPFEGGGAIRVHSGAAVILERAILRENLASFGAAILADGYAEIRDSEIRDNVYGPGTISVVANTLKASGSTFRGNGGTSGGAILSTQSAQLRNTTIAQNAGFGLHFDAPPLDGYLELYSSTVYGNTETGLIVDGIDSAFLYAESRNTAIAQNASNCFLNVPLLGYSNVTDDDTCPTDGSFDVVAEVMLAPLADNGGSSLPGNTSPWTMTPLNGSPLIEAGDADTCVSIFWDQIGNERSIDGDLDQSAVCDVGAVEYQAFRPKDLNVDEATVSSDGNGVFEPGEVVTLLPSWQYEISPLQSTLTGSISGFEGPEGLFYVIGDEDVVYGTPLPGEPFSCIDADPKSCYSLEILQFASRPPGHLDATVVEYLFSPEVAGTYHWTLHIGDSFSDVPRTSPFYPSIETLLHAQVTGGCNAGDYCPGDPNTRSQMAVFLLKALEGAGYAPPACTGVFGDVPCPSLFAAWVEDLVARGVTAGCGGGNYCPSNPVSRDQMAVFLLKTLEGPSYTPPACTGVFGDVPCPSLFAAWIEDLVARGITAGCGGGNYCPGNPVSRDQMAVFLSKTFDLTLYGP